MKPFTTQSGRRAENGWATPRIMRATIPGAYCEKNDMYIKRLEKEINKNKKDAKKYLSKILNIEYNDDDEDNTDSINEDEEAEDSSIETEETPDEEIDDGL